jgi:hypothetical protein
MNYKNMATITWYHSASGSTLLFLSHYSPPSLPPILFNTCHVVCYRNNRCAACSKKLNENISRNAGKYISGIYHLSILSFTIIMTTLPLRNSRDLQNFSQFSEIVHTQNFENSLNFFHFQNLGRS